MVKFLKIGQTTNWKSNSATYSKESISLWDKVFLQISKKNQIYKSKMSNNKKRNINGFHVNKKILSLLHNKKCK